MGKSSRLLANPDVSMREENGEGAILFNADSNSILVINPIGLVIWQFIRNHPQTQSEIVDHLKKNCKEVPLDQVRADVDHFVTDLQNKGFIGELADEN